MEVVFQKLSCLGNDIHSLLWKLGSLYLFILATYLFQVIACSLSLSNDFAALFVEKRPIYPLLRPHSCSHFKNISMLRFHYHLCLCIMMMKKLILIILLNMQWGTEFKFERRCLGKFIWVLLHMTQLLGKYIWQRYNIWDFNMWMWRSGFDPSSIGFNFRDKSCFTVCWLLNFKWSWDYHGIIFTFLLLVYKPFLKNHKGLS